MASETITRTDLTNILNEVLVNGRQLCVMTATGTTSSSGALLASIPGIFVYGATSSGGHVVLKRSDAYLTIETPGNTGLTPLANTEVVVTVYYIPTSAIFTENDDSGWIDISTGIGKYRRKNGYVAVALNKSLSVTTSWQTIGNIPEGFRPTDSGGIYFVGIPSSGTGIQLYIAPSSGDIQVKGVGTAGTVPVCGSTVYPV